MKVIINQKETETQVTNLQALAEELNLPDKGVAVAVGNVMVPRTSWATTELKENADIIIVKAFCGG